MRTLIAQGAISACLLVFAVLALRMARYIPRTQPVYRYAWTFTGLTFLVRGCNSAFHDAFATYGYLQGDGSWAWNAVIAWHPVLNHSRTFLLVAYCGVLCTALVRASRGKRLPSLGRSMAVVVAGMGVGAVTGWREEAFTYLTHYTAVASWDGVELLAMMAVLLVGLSTGLMDRTMWASLGINAFALALSTVWFVFLSRSGVGEEWAPKAFHIHWTKVCLYTAMDLLVLMQMRRVARGGPMRGFFDPRPAAPMPSLSA